ncbi:hypothetical protein [Sulfurospirillum oryzae]|uniref:hypothetical protein n=1 Tax=Sulfurospirillum oryzae TaxID=2976535 RepID=UPI0021E79BE0|nr:hypothetical protein [Sulfurospirillum oryzae]
MKIQSHSFEAPKQESGVSSKVATGVVVASVLSTGAFAADPTWLTDVNTALVAIVAMIGGVITSLVAIFIAPITWNKIKQVLQRG